MSIRELAEADLAITLESPDNFGLPVLMIDPDGVEHGPYYGQVLYDTRNYDDAGNQVTQHMPVVTLRRSSLARIPLPSEKWAVRIPLTPSLTAPKVTYVLEQPDEGGGSIGFIRLYLTKTVQS